MSETSANVASYYKGWETYQDLLMPFIQKRR